MKGPKRPTTKLYRKDYIAILKYYNIAIYENTKLNVIRAKFKNLQGLSSWRNI